MADSDPETPPAAADHPSVTQGTKRNAFTELMSPKAKKPPVEASSSSNPTARTGRHKFRDELSTYTANPASFPRSRVIYHSPDFVAIHDLYPKSSVHTLLLPRPPQPPQTSKIDSSATATHQPTSPPLDRTRLHPFDALDDPTYLASVSAEADKLKHLVAKELQRLFGRYSAQDQAREAVLNGDDTAEEAAAAAAAAAVAKELPRGRDWSREVLVGVHAHPSMNDLHIHVLSRDMHSDRVRHRKHYNSFTTPFLVPLSDFPLPAQDPRRAPHTDYLRRPFKCWRCGKDFGSAFTKLKQHLEVEFEEWKKE